MDGPPRLLRRNLETPALTPAPGSCSPANPVALAELNPKVIESPRSDFGLWTLDSAPPTSDRNPPAERAGQTIFQRLDQREIRPYSSSEYLRRFAWRWVQWLLIRPSPPNAYSWRRLWLRLFGARLRSTSRTRPSTDIIHPWLLTVGEQTILGDRVTVYNLGAIEIGDHTAISQGAHLCAGTHDHAQPHLPLLRKPMTVGSGVWICTDSFIGPGVTIGDNSVVGARAVVVKDVPPGVIVAGNPARVVKRRNLENPKA